MKANYTDIFPQSAIKQGQRNEKNSGDYGGHAGRTGLKRFSHAYPDRFLMGDCRTACGDLLLRVCCGRPASGGGGLFLFLQRAYDQILHDVCIQNLPVVFAIDRAGWWAATGKPIRVFSTCPIWSSIPNMHIMAPKNKWELSDMLKFAVAFQGPIALRYPRGEAYDGLVRLRAPIEYGPQRNDI